MIARIGLWILCAWSIFDGHLDWALVLALLAVALIINEVAP